MAQSASLASSKASESSRLSLQTTNKTNTSELDKGNDVVPGLLYYEFLPLVRRSKTTGLLEFQEFDDVVERASDWYRQICGYRVVSMETVQFKFRDKDPASSSSFSGEAKGDRSSRSDEDSTRLSAQKHYYGDGLRVWVFPCEAHINGGVELGYLDLEPQLVEQPAGCIRYETVPDLLERFNAEQATGARPVPGKVIGVESRDVRQPEKMRRDVDQGDGFSYFQLFSLRIFFYRGCPLERGYSTADISANAQSRERKRGYNCARQRDERLGREFARCTQHFAPAFFSVAEVRDVVPKPLDDYAFEDFTCVLKRASQWLHSESPLKLYNLQTLFVKAKIDVPPGTALSRKVRTLVRYLKVLRIVYSTFPESAADFASLRSPRCLSHRVFMPALSRDGRDLPVAEAIRTLKANMSLWSVGLRGNILCAESLTVDYDPSGRGPSKINASAPSKSEIMAATNAGGAAQRRARVVLYFRVYTDAPEPVEKAAAAPPTSISRPRLNANSVTLSRSAAAVANRKCRIM
ncbi:uncharacterized protein LOC119406341 [Rhipicephalus sanguineus]|uniref:uncharacterized protein LOC119406341 n=1 Tax=Rhipicephalus sanguineus TaxID=34632 RepID=UPI0020C45271|nr:uncharacterized protein LOC119406341 [Rhipicephalus sanguineus]